MISDDVQVLRMVWHPFHFDQGELVATAFEGDDLLAFPDACGAARYMSVDDLAQISRESVDWRAEWQQRDGRDERLGRHVPKFVEFKVNRLRQLKCTEARPLFELTREPMAAGEDGPGSPPNVAHCAVRTQEAHRYADLSKPRRKFILNHMRTQLMRALDQIKEYGDVFPGAA